GTMNNAATKTNAYAGAVGAVGVSARASRAHLVNFGYQINDVVVGLASGQKPLTVLIQQGSQIIGILASMGVGFKGFLQLLWGFVANPFTLGIGAIAAGLFLMSNRFSDATGKSITFTDTVVGGFRALKNAMSEEFSPLTDGISSIWDDISGPTIEVAKIT